MNQRELWEERMKEKSHIERAKHVQRPCDKKTQCAEILKAILTGIQRVKGSLAQDVVQTTHDFEAMRMIFTFSLRAMGSHKSRE